MAEISVPSYVEQDDPRREVLDGRHASVDELHKMAVIDRVANVMRPYLESLA